MAKHQLIISLDRNKNFPVRSEEGRFQETHLLVVNWTGTWGPRDRPALCLVVEPGDELEIALSAGQTGGGSLWLYNRSNPLPSLLSHLPPPLAPLPERQPQDTWERVDLETGSVLLQVNPAISRDAGESLYKLRVSSLGQAPYPLVGQGQAGNLTATRP